MSLVDRSFFARFRIYVYLHRARNTLLSLFLYINVYIYMFQCTVLHINCFTMQAISLVLSQPKYVLLEFHRLPHVWFLLIHLIVACTDQAKAKAVRDAAFSLLHRCSLAVLGFAVSLIYFIDAVFFQLSFVIIVISCVLLISQRSSFQPLFLCGSLSAVEIQISTKSTTEIVLLVNTYMCSNSMMHIHREANALVQPSSHIFGFVVFRTLTTNKRNKCHFQNVFGGCGCVSWLSNARVYWTIFFNLLILLS